MRESKGVKTWRRNESKPILGRPIPGCCWDLWAAVWAIGPAVGCWSWQRR